MKIRGYKIRALFQKDMKLSMKNRNVLVVLALPLVFSIAYNLLFADMMTMEGGMPKTYILMVCQVLTVVAIPLTVQSMMIAEEKEKNTMRTLMLSDITSTEFLLSKTAVTTLYVLIVTILNYLFCSMPVEGIFIFVVLSMITSISITLFGSMVGIMSKDQTSASTLSTPLMLFFMMPPIFANFNETLATVARVIPTYSFQRIYDEVVLGNYITTGNLIDFAVMLVWIVAGIFAFRFAYRKNLQDN